MVLPLHARSLALAALAALSFVAPARAEQAPPAAPAAGQGRGGPQAPPVVSPEVLADRRITFRIYAPNAQAIRLAAGDIPGLGQTGVMTKGENGVWAVTVGPVEPGAYRYNFNVDGVTVIDPRNPAISESNNNVWSLALVPGSELFDTKNVPHGAVAAVTYYSTALGRHRRMHVYTPPGYEIGHDEVSGLLSAARRRRLRRLVDVGRPRGVHPRQPDRDQEGQADGRRHAGGPHERPEPAALGAPFTATAAGSPARLMSSRSDFVTDLMPYVEKNYRVLTDRAESRDRGPLDGRQPDAEHRDSASRQVRLHRRLQLGPARRRRSWPWRGAGGRRAGRTRRSGSAVWRGLGEAASRGARQRRPEEGPEARLVQHRQGRRPDHDDAVHGGAAEEARLQAALFIESPGGHTWLNWRDYLRSSRRSCSSRSRRRIDVGW